jgi:hypothetical protein
VGLVKTTTSRGRTELSAKLIEGSAVHADVVDRGADRDGARRSRCERGHW